jgi:hypothetical protein
MDPTCQFMGFNDDFMRSYGGGVCGIFHDFIVIKDGV